MSETTTDEEMGYLFYFTLPAPDVEQAARFYRAVFDWNLQRGDHGYHVADVYPPRPGKPEYMNRMEFWVEGTNGEPVEKGREGKIPVG